MAKKFSEQELRDLQYVFQLFDGGGNGFLEIEDLRKALGLLGLKLSFKNLRQMAQDVELSKRRAASSSVGGGSKSRFDNTKKPKTDLQGFLHIVAGLQDTSYDHYEEMGQAFSFLDEDGDGYITDADLQKYGRPLGLKRTDLQGMLEDADKDGDGKISLEEFVTTMKQTNMFKHT